MQININNKNCCSEKPVIQLTAGEKLCKNHFNEYFENKVFKTIRQFDLLGKEERILSYKISAETAFKSPITFPKAMARFKIRGKNYISRSNGNAVYF